MRGFTIIELLVALAIVSILLILSIPSITGFVTTSVSQGYCNILTKINYYLATYRATSYPNFTYPANLSAASVFGNEVPKDPYSGKKISIVSVPMDSCPSQAPSSDVIVYCYNQPYTDTASILPSVSDYKLVISNTVALSCPLGVGE